MHTIEENPDGTVSIPPAPPGRGSMYRLGLESGVAQVNALSRVELNAVALAARLVPFPLGDEEKVYAEVLGRLKDNPYEVFEKGSAVWTSRLSTLRGALLEQSARGMNAPTDTYLSAAVKYLHREDGYIYHEPEWLTAEYHGQQRLPGVAGLGGEAFDYSEQLRTQPGMTPEQVERETRRYREALKYYAIQEAIDRGDCGGAIEALAKKPTPEGTRQVIAACGRAPSAVGDYPMQEERVSLGECSSERQSFSKLWIDVCSSRPSGVLGPQVKLPQDAAAVIAEHAPWMFESHTEEHVVALLLNNRHYVVGMVRVGRGSMTQSIVDIQGAFRAALLAAAVTIVFVHNHPGGDPGISADDRNVYASAQITSKHYGSPIQGGIKVLDFIAVATGPDGQRRWASAEGGSGVLEGKRGKRGKSLGNEADDIRENLASHVWSMADPEPVDRVVSWENAPTAFRSLIKDTGQGVEEALAEAARAARPSRITGRPAGEDVLADAHGRVEWAARLMLDQLANANSAQVQRYQDDFDAFVNQE